MSVEELSLSLHAKRAIANRPVVSNKIKSFVNDFIFPLLFLVFPSEDFCQN